MNFRVPIKARKLKGHYRLTVNLSIDGNFVACYEFEFSFAG